MSQAKQLRERAAALEAQANSFEAYEKLTVAMRAVYDARRALEFPEHLNELEKRIEMDRRRIALNLGHPDRVATLILAGMDEERAGSYDLITDEAAAGALATFLFDTVGRYGPGRMENSAVKLALSIFPMGVEFWKQGRHDT